MMKHALGLGLGLLTLAGAAAADTKTETIEYYDETTLWVLGQVKRMTTDGVETARTDYGWKALPWKTYAFGKLQQVMSYDATSTIASGQLGTLKTVSDARDSGTFDTTTTLSNWKRGIPQTITFPDTGDGPKSKSAVVDELGQIVSVVDETGAKTCYGYDPMGRVNRVTQPSQANPGVCDTSSSNETLSTFAPMASTKYGIAAGHWKQTVHTGDGYKDTYFDAFWRPLVVETYDSADPANTRSVTVTRYDAHGRVIYQSNPTRTTPASYASSNQGTWTTYDALGRPTRIEQDSELASRLVTTIVYPSTAFERRTTDPRGFQTTERFQTFDEPSFDAPVLIDAPENLRTTIARDVFGKPASVTRGPRS